MRRFLGGLGSLMLAAACGGGGSTEPDARVVDGAIDADVIDADVPPDASTTVDVTVYSAGVLAEGVAVQVHDATGAFVQTVTTDASGHVAITDFPSGGAVTAPVSGQRKQQSVADHDPGSAGRRPAVDRRPAPTVPAVRRRDRVDERRHSRRRGRLRLAGRLLRLLGRPDR